ncbi:hypothetical protein [uncultured Dubosiella sp.]|nr:hypothetical protein [uncultured Dubosiella sp.]
MENKNRQNVIEGFRNLVQKEEKKNPSAWKTQNAKNAMRELLENLDQNPTPEGFEIVWIGKLEGYLGLYGRLLYSEITSFLSNKCCNELKLDGFFATFEHITENIDHLLEFSKNSSNGVKTETQKVILKVWDHINLVQDQYEFFYTSNEKITEMVESEINSAVTKEVNKIMDDLNAFREELNKAEEDLENSKKEVENIKTELKEAKKDLDKAQKEIYTQLISIVSIFVAIAFVMFGGMSLMNGLFDYSKLKEVPLFAMLCSACLIGIVILCALYCFVVLIARLVGKDIIRSQDGMPKSLRKALIGLVIAGIIFFICYGEDEYNWITNLNKNHSQTLVSGKIQN